MNSIQPPALPFKISVLAFVTNKQGELLLMKRNRAPNLGCWSPIGGKLEMSRGESPFECVIREVQEEIALTVAEKDLHLFGYIAEKSYEGHGHWLLFLFNCRVELDYLPPAIDEGEFAFFTRAQIDALSIPETDRTLLWPNYDRHRDGFIALRANCNPEATLQVTQEQLIQS